MPDITSFDFSAIDGTDATAPVLQFDIALSDGFSNLSSISVLYWAVNAMQVWVNIPRDPVSGHFQLSIDLPQYARAGDYAVRAVNLVTNGGTDVAYNQAQLEEGGYDTTLVLANPNADNEAPVIDQIVINGYSFDTDGNLHITMDVWCHDSYSGLLDSLGVEIMTPSGQGLQKWGTADENGKVSLEFQLNKFSPSGTYSVNTIRITDKAGNDTFGYEYLQSNPTSIAIENPNSDNTIPVLEELTLDATFDPLTQRPQINFRGVVTDDLSGVVTTYVRISSPTVSDIDKFLGGDGTLSSSFSNYIALPINFTPGRYDIVFLTVVDAAGNLKNLTPGDLEGAGLPTYLNVYFPESLESTTTTVTASTEADFVFGSDITDDALSGGEGSDFLFSGDGNDTVDAGSGNDLIVGGNGAGDDTYIGGSGFDTVKYTSATAAIAVDLWAGTAGSVAAGDAAGIGTDQLSGIENIIAGNLADRIAGSGFANRLDGMDGDDQLNGRGGNDTLFGGNGNDTMIGGIGDDKLIGGLGSDTASYSGATGGVTVSLALAGAQDTLGAGLDTLSFIENLRGSDLADRLSGNDAANTLWGALGDDVLFGNGGNDRLDGGAGADRMLGGAGNDTYVVDSGLDRVFETTTPSSGIDAGGNDTVLSALSLNLAAYPGIGFVENLTLTGSAAINATGNALANTLTGNGAANTLTGGAGKDTMTGGLGADRFVFADGDFGGATGATGDIIRDFSKTEGDKILLNLVDANSANGSATNEAFSFIGTAAFGQVAGQLRSFQTSANTFVQGDTNGDGTADFVLVLTGALSLAAADFVL